MGGFHVIGDDARLLQSDQFVEVLNFALGFLKSPSCELAFALEVVYVLLGLFQLFLVLFVEFLEQVQFVHQSFVVGSSAVFYHLCLGVDSAGVLVG